MEMRNTKFGIDDAKARARRPRPMQLVYNLQSMDARARVWLEEKGRCS
jgi:hypothetical protein